MNKLKEINNDINIKRKRLEDSFETRGFDDNKTQKLSRELDELILKQMKLQGRKNLES